MMEVTWYYSEGNLVVEVGNGRSFIAYRYAWPDFDYDEYVAGKTPPFVLDRIEQAKAEYAAK